MKCTIPLMKRRLSACSATCFMSMRQMFEGGILCVAGEYLIRLLQFVLLICVWKALAGEGGGLAHDYRGKAF